MSSPDLDSFHIDDSEATLVKIDSPTDAAVASSKASRKRGRSSVDLQQNVRNLLHTSRSSSSLRGDTTVLPDRSIAQSIVRSGGRTPSSSTKPKGLQSPQRSVSEFRVPIQKDFGKKRTCCGSEAAMTLRREGPGMWEGVL
jgi:hypothetical protein